MRSGDDADCEAVKGRRLFLVASVSIGLMAVAVFDGGPARLRAQSGFEPAEPAWRKYGADIYKASRRMRQLAGEKLDREQPTEYDDLTAKQVEERIAPARKAMEADLRRDVPDRQPSYQTLETLAKLRGAAAPAIPTILEQLDRWGPDARFHIPFVCEAMKSLAKIAPTSPDVIKAASRVIEQNLPAKGICHTCGCALELLEVSGAAARPIAGPVLTRAMAEPRFLTTYDWQLGRALTAVGLTSGDATRQAVTRALDPNALPGNRAGVLKALATESATANATDRTVIREAAARLMTSDMNDVRAAAAETLGATGPEAVPALQQALNDWHYEVRVAAAKSLGKIGKPAKLAAPALAVALDPFLGTAAAAGAALIAIGPDTLPIVDTRLATVPANDRARPVLAAVAATLRDPNRRDHLTPALESMAYGDRRHDDRKRGFLAIEPLKTMTRGRPYQPGKDRLRARFTVLRYGSPGKRPSETGETAIVVDQGFTYGIAALAGRRPGDRVRLLMSPDIAQSPVYGTPKHQSSWNTHINGTTGYFDITIDRVCEPQIWRLFRGGGIIGEIKIETSCRD